MTPPPSVPASQPASYLDLIRMTKLRAKRRSLNAGTPPPQRALQIRRLSSYPLAPLPTPPAVQDDDRKSPVVSYQLSRSPVDSVPSDGTVSESSANSPSTSIAEPTSVTGPSNPEPPIGHAASTPEIAENPSSVVEHSLRASIASLDIDVGAQEVLPVSNIVSFYTNRIFQHR